MPKWLQDLGTSAGNFISGIGSSALDWVWDEDTGINYENLVPLIGLIAASRADDSETIGDFMGLSPPTPTGYTGGIPDYTYSRELVPNAFSEYERDNAGVLSLDVNEQYIPRRPGGKGRRYFQDTSFTETEEMAGGGLTSRMTGKPNPFDASVGLFPNPQPEGLPEEVTAQVTELVRNYGTPDKGNTFGVPRFQDNAEVMTYEYPYGVNARFEESLDIVNKIVELENTMATGSDRQKEQAARQIEELKSFGAAVNGIPQNSFEKFVEVQKLRNSQTPVKKAAGGLASLPHNGYYLGGPTDGMADQVPAMISNSQPAALSDGEFVIPADVVSHLGNGNSDAGAEELFAMMERVRQARTGNPKQGKEINPKKYLA